MADTLFADVSSFQPGVNDSYPYRFLSFRSNDGTYQDSHFAYNLAWAKHACDTGRMDGFLVYFVWEPNWQATLATFKFMVGTPHRRMAVMMDVESWSGRIRGDRSGEINACWSAVVAWLGGNRKRVIGYANAGDFANLWPHRPTDLRVVLANYSSNPGFPGKIAHQFTDHMHIPPFGFCDANSADGLSPAQFAAALGLTPAPTPHPTPTTHPAPLTTEDEMAKLFHVEGSPAVYTDFYGGYRHVVNPAAYSKIEKDCADAKIPLHHFTITADQHAENLKAVA